jgi:hypothetical protein
MRKPFSRTTIDDRPVHDGVLAQMRDALLRKLGRLRPAAAKQALVVMEDESQESAAAVLSFPVRGEALLVNLANALRECVPQGGEGSDPFQITMLRSARPRLSIDRDAYVEFHVEDGTFHLKIDAAPSSRLTLETPDFAVLVKFVRQYLTDRYGGPETAGAGA